MCGRVREQKKSLEMAPPEPEYIEDETGARVEVREELRAEAAGIRRDVAASTGRLPAAVPMAWPSAYHLFQAQANLETREVGATPLYEWGKMRECDQISPAPGAGAFPETLVADQATLELVERLKAAPPREWPAPMAGL